MSKSTEMQEVEIVDDNTVETVEGSQPPPKPFRLMDALCWASAGIVSAILSVVLCIFDGFGSCKWWWALVVTPIAFIVIGIAFEYFVVEKRRHLWFCCLPKWKKTGIAFVLIELFIYSVSAYVILAEGLDDCKKSSSPAARWALVSVIGCVLLLSIGKDIIALLPPPESYTRLQTVD